MRNRFYLILALSFFALQSIFAQHMICTSLRQAYNPSLSASLFYSIDPSPTPELEVGTVTNFDWATIANDITTVKLEYLNIGGDYFNPNDWHYFAWAYYANGTYPWNVPAYLENQETYFRISVLQGNTNHPSHTVLFKIVPNGGRTVAPIPPPAAKTDLATSNLTLNCYPNPTTDKLILEGKQLEQAAIFDLNGQMVREYYFDAHTRQVLEVEDLNAGMYFISINNDKQQMTFIKK